MNYRSTRQVEQLFGINNIALKIYQGRVEAPAKGPTGSYMWLPADIEKASWVLRRRSADDVIDVTVPKSSNTYRSILEAL